MIQPSFEYLEDKKVLRQVPEMEEVDPFNFSFLKASSKKRRYELWLASLPTYPVTTPTEQWEREVRGRKDLKIGVEFRLAYNGISADPSGSFGSTWGSSHPMAIPLPVQEEVKGGDEGEASRLSMGMKVAEDLQKEMHRYIEMAMGKSSKVTYQDCVTGFLLWKIGELKALLTPTNKSNI